MPVPGVAAAVRRYWIGTTEDGLHRVAGALGYGEASLLRDLKGIEDSRAATYVSSLEGGASAMTVLRTAQRLADKESSDKQELQAPFQGRCIIAAEGSVCKSDVEGAVP